MSAFAPEGAFLQFSVEPLMARKVWILSLVVGLKRIARIFSPVARRCLSPISPFSPWLQCCDWGAGAACDMAMNASVEVDG